MEQEPHEGHTPKYYIHLDKRPTTVHYAEDSNPGMEFVHRLGARTDSTELVSSRPASVAATDDEDSDDYDWSGEEEDLRDEEAKFEEHMGNTKKQTRKGWGFRRWFTLPFSLLWNVDLLSCPGSLPCYSPLSLAPHSLPLFSLLQASSSRCTGITTIQLHSVSTSRTMYKLGSSGLPRILSYHGALLWRLTWCLFSSGTSFPLRGATFQNISKIDSKFMTLSKTPSSLSFTLPAAGSAGISFLGTYTNCITQEIRTRAGPIIQSGYAPIGYIIYQMFIFFQLQDVVEFFFFFALVIYVKRMLGHFIGSRLEFILGPRCAKVFDSVLFPSNRVQGAHRQCNRSFECHRNPPSVSAQSSFWEEISRYRSIRCIQ